MKRTHEQKWRDGNDLTIAIVVLIIACVCLVGVLHNKGLLTFIP